MDGLAFHFLLFLHVHRLFNQFRRNVLKIRKGKNFASISIQEKQISAPRQVIFSFFFWRSI